MTRLFVALLLICLAAAWGCAGEPEPEPATATPQQVAQTTQSSPPTTQPEQPTQGSASSGQSGQSSSASSDADDEDKDSKKDDADATVSRANPGLTGTAFDSSRNDALFGAEPLDAVTWSLEPTISPGALEAAGTLSGGAMLFDPTVDGEGASFAVYYKDHTEPMVLLLPNLGPMDVWDSEPHQSRRWTTNSKGRRSPSAPTPRCSWT